MGFFMEIKFAAEISIGYVGCCKATAIGTCNFFSFVIEKFDIFVMYNLGSMMNRFSFEISRRKTIWC